MVVSNEELEDVGIDDVELNSAVVDWDCDSIEVVGVADCSTDVVSMLDEGTSVDWMLEDDCSTEDRLLDIVVDCVVITLDIVDDVDAIVIGAEVVPEVDINIEVEDDADV